LPFGKEHNLPFADNALVVKEISAVRNKNSTHHATSGRGYENNSDAIFLLTETDLGATTP
jgi:hypothetical protein